MSHVLSRAAIGVLILAVFTGCSRTDAGSAERVERVERVEREARYGCRTHPDIVLPKPGPCPICGEPLRPIDPSPAGTLAERAPDLDERRDR